MALEGSHIRFAADLAALCHAGDMNAFIAGTVYPDSRYLTGTDRRLTHPEDFREWNMHECSDFQKGWYLHLLCDKIQPQILQEFLPTIYPSGKIPQGSDAWIGSTALKILQDTDDRGKFDVKPYLHCLDYAENPNGENILTIREFNRLFQQLYREPVDLLARESKHLWVTLGLDDALIEKLYRALEDYAADPAIMSAIPHIYPKILSRAKQQLSA